MTYLYIFNELLQWFLLAIILSNIGKLWIALGELRVGHGRKYVSFR